MKLKVYVDVFPWHFDPKDQFGPLVTTRPLDDDPAPRGGKRYVYTLEIPEPPAVDMGVVQPDPKS